MTQNATELLLPNRQGQLPPDIAYLRDKYPRADWPAHANLGETARFWLQMHDMFRELGALLKSGTDDFREGRLDADQFQRFFVPRLNYFLGHLDGHHNVEDYQYFPLFRRYDKRLVAGFDLLENDHGVIHEGLADTARAGQSLMGAMAGDDDARRRAADAYAAQSEKLLAFLLRHLDDEEDLVIPSILEHTEAALFTR